MGMLSFRRRRAPGEPPPPPRPPSKSPVAECQICGRKQRLRDGLLVLHGYKRPGHGEAEGRCPGVGYPPYEVSIDQLRVWIEQLRFHRDHLAEAIAEIDAGRRSREIVRYSTLWNRPPVVTRPGDPSWNEELRRVRSDLENQRGNIDSEIVMQSRRVEAWPGPREVVYVPMVPSSGTSRDPEKVAARAAARAAREAEKAAKAIAAPDGSPLRVGGDWIRTKIAARNALAGAVRDNVLYGPKHPHDFPKKIQQLSEALLAAGIDPVPIIQRAVKQAEKRRW